MFGARSVILAVADPLTGVANLRAFERFVDQSTEQSKTGFALLMVDMNGLKGANTVFGHETGDGMVVRLAKLMLQVKPLSRSGGEDRRGRIRRCPAPCRRQEVELWRGRFERLVSDHNVKIRGKLPQISVSTGSALFPDAGSTADDLIDAADRQMYEQRTPAVAPPFEIDVAAPTIAGRLLRSARFANTPKRTYEPVDVLGQATANWIVVGSLTLLTIFLSGSLTNTVAAVVVGMFGLFNAGLCVVALRVQKRKPLLAFIDVSTILFGGMSLLATGGSESPIQLAALLPTAFYARFLHGRAALLHVGALILVYTVTFWGYGDVSPAGESLFATIVTAMIVVAGIMQFSSGSLVDSLRIVRESATHDPLTNAPNLYAFRDDLTAAIESMPADDVHERRPALVIADIDDFRKLNTLGGHRAGDMILQQAVERVNAELGDAGKVYRIGGDELAVLFEVERLAEATETADRCRRSLEFRSRELPQDEQRVTASVGFAVWHSPLTAAEFVETVETALGHSKKAHGRTVPAGTNVML